MGWVEVLPKYEAIFRDARWDSAASFLSWTGILVNRHRKRSVEQVFLPSPPGRGAGGEGFAALTAGMNGTSANDAVPSPPAPLPEGEGRASFFLKKESGVRYRDLFRNAWHGFGWCATAVREGAILQAAQRVGIGCPEVVALGECEREAFLLTRDESAMIELRIYLARHDAPNERARLADALGRELAKVHDAGFDHPDLFAKHILVGDDARFCILDWQRARWRKSVPWRLRMRDLALLDATLHDGLASDRLRVRCLRAYVQATRGAVPPLARLACHVRGASARLRSEQNIREIGQLPIAAKEQQFVQLHGGRMLVVRSYFEEQNERVLEGFAKLMETDHASRDVRTHSLTDGVRVESHAASHRDMPTLAHTLFRLQRFGIAAPRLIAICWSATHAHVITREPTTMPFDEACAKGSAAQRGQWLLQAGELVRRVHDAGYSLPFGENWPQRLGVDLATGDVVLHRVEPIERRASPWQEFAPTELSQQKMHLSRHDRLRFLSGYLRQPRARRFARAMPTLVSLERQAIG